jgi:2-oxo-3-hexenedioate decarboxylase
MDWDDAYAIQDAILARKLARGARVVGLKAGLTSHAKMKQMGVTDPVFGFLVDDYSVPEGRHGADARSIHPKVEPEIVVCSSTPSRDRAAISAPCWPPPTSCCRASR